jgi:hypothetical protein
MNGYDSFYCMIVGVDIVLYISEGFPQPAYCFFLHLRLSLYNFVGIFIPALRLHVFLRLS